MTSCRSSKETTKTEYVYVDRCTVDTVIKVEADTASLMALIECDSLGNALISQIETLQGQRVNVAPQIEYRYVTDPNGKVRRTAYFAVLSMADSLQTEVNILNEKLRSSSETNTEEKRTSPVMIFLIGMAAGIILSLLLVILISK